MERKKEHISTPPDSENGFLPGKQRLRALLFAERAPGTWGGGGGGERGLSKEEEEEEKTRRSVGTRTGVTETWMQTVSGHRLAG